MIELVLMASVASSSFGQLPPPSPLIDSVVLIASVPPSSSIPSLPPASGTPAPAPASGSGSQTFSPSPQQQTPPLQPQQQQPKESWADKMWRRYNENKGRN